MLNRALESLKRRTAVRYPRPITNLFLLGKVLGVASFTALRMSTQLLPLRVMHKEHCTKGLRNDGDMRLVGGEFGSRYLPKPRQARGYVTCRYIVFPRLSLATGEK